jgi:hypothetical protein
MTEITTQKSKFYMDKEGRLQVEINGHWLNTRCPHTNEPCGMKCPLLDELDGKHITLLCGCEPIDIALAKEGGV